MTSVKTINTDTPALDHVCGLLEGYRASHVINVATSLEIFDHVYEGPGHSMSAAALVEKQGWHSDATLRMLNALVSLKLLQKSQGPDGEVFSVTESGNYLRRRNSPSVWGYAKEIDLFGSMLAGAAAVVKNGPSAHGHHHDGHGHGEHGHGEHGHGHESHGHGDHGHQGPRHHEHGHHEHGHHEDGNRRGHEHGNGHEDEWKDFYDMADGLGKPHVKQLLTALDLSKYSTAVDLGGGSGFMSFELARSYPGTCVTLLEHQNAIDIVKQKFVPKGENLNVKLMAGDFMKGDIPAADLIMLAHVIHDYSEDNAHKLLDKIHAATNPGGAILIFEKLMNDKKDGPSSVHLWDLIIMSSHTGGLRSGQEYADLLTQHGYGNIQVVRTQENCPYDMILAEKL